jgi:hypothetical protein
MVTAVKKYSQAQSPILSLCPGRNGAGHLPCSSTRAFEPQSLCDHSSVLPSTSDTMLMIFRSSRGCPVRLVSIRMTSLRLKLPSLSSGWMSSSASISSDVTPVSSAPFPSCHILLLLLLPLSLRLFLLIILLPLFHLSTRHPCQKHHAQNSHHTNSKQSSVVGC